MKKGLSDARHPHRADGDLPSGMLGEESEALPIRGQIVQDRRGTGGIAVMRLGAGVVSPAPGVFALCSRVAFTSRVSSLERLVFR